MTLCLALLLPAMVFAQCPSISSSVSMPLCAGEPVTFTISDPNYVNLSWQTSTSPDFTNSEVFVGSLSITFAEGFTEDTYIKANIFLCSDPVFQINVHQQPNINVIQFDDDSIEVNGSIATVDCSTTLPIEIEGIQSPNLNISSSNFLWEMSEDQIDWQPLAADDPDLTIPALPTEDLYLRRTIYPVACSSISSNTLFIDVTGKPEGGILSESQTYCEDQPFDDLTLSGYYGDIVQWEISTDGVEFTAIDGSEGLTDFEPINITGTHHYHVLIEVPGCEPVYSTEVEIEVFPPVDNTITTPDQFLCDNEIPITITGNAPSGGDGSYSTFWQQQLAGSNWTAIGGQPDSLAFSDPLTGTTYFRRIIADGSGCEAIDTAAVFVTPQSDAGNFTDSGQEICPDTEAETISVENFTGELIWQRLDSSDGIWTSTEDVTSELEPNVISATTYYRVIAKTDYCEPDTSEVYSIEIFPSITNNTIGEDQSLCGESVEDLTGLPLSGGSGPYIYEWHRSLNETDWDANQSNNPVYNPNDFVGTQHFRRIVTSGCFTDTSNTVTVSRSLTTDAGDFKSTSYQELCPEASADEIEVENFSGELEWLESNSPSGEWESIGYIGSIHSPGQISETTYYRIVAHADFCEPDTSDLYEIFVFPPISDNVIGNDQSFCGGGAADPLTSIEELSGGSGYDYDYEWQSSLNGTDWTPANASSNNNPVYPPGEVDETLYFRRIVSSDGCFTDTSNVVTISVTSTSDAGNFADSDQQVCPDTEAENITIENFIGEIMDWQISDSPSGPWTSTGNTNTTLDPGEILSPTYLRVVVQNGDCDSDISETYTIDVFSPIANNTIGANQWLCVNETPETLIGSDPEEGTGNYSFLWQSSADLTEWTAAPNVNDTINYTPVSFTGTQFFRRIVFSDSCFVDTSNTVTVITSPLSDAGYFTDGGQEICPETDAEIITIQNHTGEILDWLKSSSLDGPWIPQGSTENAFTPGTTDDPTFYRVVVKTEYCEPDTSDVYSILMYPEITNNSIGPDQTLCLNESPAELWGTEPEGAAGDATYQYAWEQNISSNEWEPADGLNSEQNYQPFEQLGAVQFRRLAISEECPVDTSNAITIETSPLSNAGNFTDSGQEICPETEAGDITIENFTGEIIDWLESDSPDGGWSSTGNGTTTIEPGFISDASFFRVIVKTNYCAPDTSEVYAIEMHPDISNNTVYGSQELCSAEVPDELTGDTPEGGTGLYEYLWQSRTLTSEWSDAAGINDQLNYTIDNIAETMFFRRLVFSGDCPADTSNTLTIKKSPLSNSGFFTDTDNEQHICPGTYPEPIVLTDYTGLIINWHSSPSPVGPWTPIGNTSSVLTPGSLEQNKYYRVIVQTEYCDGDTSDVYSIEIYPDITGNIIGEDQLLCFNENPQEITGLTPEGGNDSMEYEYLWQNSSDSVEWVTASGTIDQMNFLPSDLSENMFFRRLVISGECPIDTSNTVFIELRPEVSGSFSGGGDFCPDETQQIHVQLLGTPPFSIEYTDGEETFIEEDITSNVFSLPINVDTATTFTLTTVWDAFCESEENMATSTVEVIPVPEIQEVVAGSDTSICGLSYTVTGTPNAGENEIGTWTDQAGNELSTNATFTFISDEPGIHELTYTIENEICGTAKSDSLWIIFDIPETANGGNDLVMCSESITMQAVPVEWGVGHWSISEDLDINDPFDPEATISGFEYGTSHSVAWIVESVMDVCPADTAWVSIHVDALSEAGTISASSENICAGDEVTFDATGFTGTITSWAIQDENEEITTIDNSDSTFVSSEFNENLAMFTIVQSGVCPPDSSDALLLTVHSPTDPGTLNSDQEVCAGENSGSLEITGHNGEILFWEIASDESVDSLFNNQPLLNFENLNITALYRAKVQSGVCDAAWSNTATVEVLPEISIPFEVEDQYCSDHSSIDLNTLIDENYTGQWEINGNPSDQFIPADHAGSESIITYTYTGYSCGTTSSDTTIVYSIPEITLTGETQICGLEADIQASTSVGTGYWTADDGLVLGGEATEAAMNVVALEYGPFNITWTADNEGCINSADQTIHFYEQPTEANAGEDQFLDFTYQTELSANQPEVGIGNWSSNNPTVTFFDEQNPSTIINNLQVGQNQLFWNISNGSCPVSTSEVIIEVKSLIVPDAFSPNGDNVNDLYEIHGLEEVGPVSLKVWNRWGQIVHETTDYQNNWAGLNKNGNELPADTYYYLLEIDALNETYKGFIVLQR